VKLRRPTGRQVLALVLGIVLGVIAGVGLLTAWLLVASSR